MLRIPQTFTVLKMSLGSLYQRLLVAAGAVAFLVVNWFCRPARRQPPVEPQPIERAPEQEALLESDDEEASDVDSKGASDVISDRNEYVAPELSQPDGHGQLLVDAAAAPEDVLLEPVQDASPVPRHSHERRRIRESVLKQPSQDRESSFTAARSTETAQPPASEERASVDEAYLRSLIDNELGGSQFAVRGRAPGPGNGRSLPDLLDQAFGPPRFAVAKPMFADIVPQSGFMAGMEVTEAGMAMASLSGAKVPPIASCAASGSTAVAATAAAGPSNKTPSGTRGAGGVKRSAEELALGAETDSLVALESQGLMVLTLSVTQGPASGIRMVADPAGEYTIGRLPESWLQILDQEVSGRHAAVRWDGGSRRWMLRDVGSLNGTVLDGEPIGREYKVPGDERPLAHGDVVQLGSYTVLSVELSEARTEPAAPDAAAAAVAAPVASKRQHRGAGSDASSSAPEAFGGSIVRCSHMETVAGLQGLPTPGLLVDCPELGARLCVHNKLGVDHKRLSQGCEDVPHWELPFAPYSGAGIVCIFDGHHGSKAAKQAKEYLAAILRAKLLRRDGRQPPPLPPPAPPTPPRRAEDEDEEEEIAEVYDGVGSDDLLEEEPAERSDDGTAAAATVPTAMAQADSRVETGGAEAATASTASLTSRDGGSAASGEAGGSVQERSGGGVAAAAGPADPEAAVGNGGHPDVHVTGAEEEGLLEELPPPPPTGPPLPPLLRGRGIEAQRSLLRDTFLLADKYMSMGEGCTATLVMVDADPDPDPQRGGWLLQSSNVGDSSAVLVNFTRGSWFKLSEDHRIASSSSERERLAAMGHMVRTRLYGLNISRMLGDRFLKEENLGFLAEPYVSMAVQVPAGDHAVLIVASDGLWDAVPEERAARMLLQEATRSSITSIPRWQAHPLTAASQLSSSFSSSATGLAPPPTGIAAAAVPPSAALGCQTVADMLLTKALVQRSKDDITISVLELGPHLWPQSQQPGAAAAGSART